MMTTIDPSTVEPLRLHNARHWLWLVLWLLASAAMLTWAWNTSANGLFGMPLAQFRHGFSVSVALLATIAMCRLVWNVKVHRE